MTDDKRKTPSAERMQAELAQAKRVKTVSIGLLSVKGTYVCSVTYRSVEDASIKLRCSTETDQWKALRDALALVDAYEVARIALFTNSKTLHDEIRFLRTPKPDSKVKVKGWGEVGLVTNDYYWQLIRHLEDFYIGRAVFVFLVEPTALVWANQVYAGHKNGDDCNEQNKIDDTARSSSRSTASGIRSEGRPERQASLFDGANQ